VATDAGCNLALCASIITSTAPSACCGVFAGAKCVVMEPASCAAMGGISVPAPMCAGDLNGDGKDEACGIVSFCGDGVPQPPEQCDDGNPFFGDGCTPSCTVEQISMCGNGIPEMGEQCDDGNPFFGDGCTPSCTLEQMPICGNGIPEAGEQCDDGNPFFGDGCTPSCTVEQMPMCGNGVTEFGEQCDDGNFVFGDGCTPSCTIEQMPMCGNGVTEFGEQCDDGNFVFGDGCSPSCTIENIGACAVVVGSTQSCCGSGGAPGCGNTLCCEAVCAADPFCCNVQWDGACASAASNIPGCGCGLCLPGQCDAPTTVCQSTVCDPATGACVPWPAEDGQACDDSNPCTTQDVCQQGACVGSPVQCDDKNACTMDLCAINTGCVHTEVVCVSDPCTVSWCDTKLGCTYTLVVCEDQDPCTDDFCSPGGGCTHLPRVCDDGSVCTEDSCGSDGECVYDIIPCDDGVDCTFDFCSPGGGCYHELVDAYCDDQDVCTWDVCDALSGCIYTDAPEAECDDGDPCTLDFCHPLFGCLHIDNGLCVADIDVDSDNDGGVNGGPSRSDAEDGVETTAPGKWIPLNDDDDDSNKKPDLQDEPPPAQENDWVPAVIEIKPAPCQAPGKWRLSYTGGVQVYKSDKKTQIPSQQVQNCPLNPTPQTLMLEGVVVSGQLGSTTVTLEYDSDGDGTWDKSDQVVATVIQCDLDVDSNNDSKAADFAPQRDNAEDLLELDRSKLGRVVAVNHDDDDKDGVEDYLDGYNLDGVVGVAGKPEFADNANANENDFVAMVVEVNAPVDPTKAVLRFEYSASDPSKAPLGGVPPLPQPAPGELRIWNTKDTRKKESVLAGGNWIPAATNIEASKLGITGASRAATVFLEGIRPSAAQGSTTVRLSMDPDGAGPAGFVHSDLVRLTVVSLDLAATDAAYLPQNTNTTSHEAKLLPATLTCTMEFELDSSSIPGEAMNFGTQKGTDKDYRFAAASNAGFAIDAAGQKATAAAKAKSNKITTTSLDFGGRARLQAVCTDLPVQSQRRPVPLDSDNDSLPDAYEDAQPNSHFSKAKRDTDGDGVLDGEEDDDPVRAVTENAGPIFFWARTPLGLSGDGFVAFEEYRGFRVQTKHVRTVSRKKDVFVFIEPNVPVVGAGMFANLTDFDVRRVRADEWSGTATRRMNEKRDASIVGASHQLGLWVERNDGLQILGQANTSGLPNQSPNEATNIEIDVDDHMAGGFGDDGVNATRTAIHTGGDGICDTLAGMDDVQAIPKGRGKAGTNCVGPGVNGASNSPLAGDDVLVAATQIVTSGPDGVCNTTAAGDDVQLLGVGAGAPDEPCITVGPNGTLDTINGLTAGADAKLCTLDDGSQALTAAEKSAALSESVGHECGHAVHLEHTFCLGDVAVISLLRGQPAQVAVRSGLNGVCDSNRLGDDVALIPKGQGAPNSTCVDGGGNGLAMGSAPAGDDVVAGNIIHSGPDGICNTAKKGDDTQSLPVGQGTPNSNCIHNGADGITQSAAAGGDVQVIGVGRGAPNAVCINPGADGVLISEPEGDDVKVGQTINAGPNGICQSVPLVDAASATIMTSNIVLPVPTTYSVDELNQVRFHLKHK
jgi:cysteine-rich repeat protein